jgi:general secretion pathway protein C
MKNRPAFEKFYPYLMVVFFGFCIADVAVLYARGYMIPESAPAAKEAAPFTNDVQPKSAYNSITSRNIFNPDGTIPDALAAKETKGSNGGSEVAEPSSLPLNLVGTIVHSNPEKSIANIELKSKNAVFAFTPNRDIEKLATLLKVERNKAYIRNSNNGRLEYIEIKEANKISFQSSKPTAGATPAGPAKIKQTGNGKFEIKRDELNKYLSDVSSILMQASSVPRKKPSGEIDGYTILGIQPNTVFSQLGIQSGDTITKVNGEPIDSPAKAIELFNALKSAPNVKLSFERDGREQENDYNIR